MPQEISWLDKEPSSIICALHQQNMRATTVWAVRATLPRPLAVGWDAIPEGLVSRAAGSGWLSAGRTALLIVPSVIILEEDNVLINPAHPDGKRVAATKVRRFIYDHRV